MTDQNISAEILYSHKKMNLIQQVNVRKKRIRSSGHETQGFPLTKRCTPKIGAKPNGFLPPLL